MPGPRFLDGDQIALRTLEPEDLSFLQTYRNRPDVRRPLGRDRPQNRPSLEDDFEGYMSDGVTLLVCRDEEPVGFVALFDWSESSGRVEIAYWITPDNQGKGYGSEAVGLAVEYAFDERRFHKVVAGAHAHNDASRDLLESLGFQQEGRRREHVFLDGEYVDSISYGLLESEWRQRQ
jgi:RimJ/RimL family protein N-acetyltransferase